MGIIGETYAEESIFGTLPLTLSEAAWFAPTMMVPTAGGPWFIAGVGKDRA
jgi:hypothetical protein